MNRRDSKGRGGGPWRAKRFCFSFVFKAVLSQQENTSTDARGLLNEWRQTKGSRTAPSLRPTENVHPKARAYGTPKTKNCPDFIKPKETRKWQLKSRPTQVWEIIILNKSFLFLSVFALGLPSPVCEVLLSTGLSKPETGTLDSWPGHWASYATPMFVPMNKGRLAQRGREVRACRAHAPITVSRWHAFSGQALISGSLQCLPT